MAKDKKGKIPTITELPSGSYRMQAWDNAAKRKISFVADDCETVMREYLEWRMAQSRKIDVGITVGEAVDRYINAKRGTLAPSTIEGYENKRRNSFKSLMDLPCKKLTPEIVQAAISAEKTRISYKSKAAMSSKTVKNAYALIESALKMQNITLPDVTLPEETKRIVELPEASEVLAAIVGTKSELPALLAMWLSLSMSEVRGIQVDAIKNGYLTIKESRIRVGGVDMKKNCCKEFERTRKLQIPDRIMRLIEETEAWKNQSGYIVPESGKVIWQNFTNALKKAGVQHMRFHDLRHMNASIMTYLNIPERYAMERGGWKRPDTLRKVYQHTFSKERVQVDNSVDEFMNGLFDDLEKNK